MTPQPNIPSHFLRRAREVFDSTRELRRDLHRHPELGFREVRTAGIVARHLHELGLEVATGVGETGVVGLLQGERPGPVVMLRFDMDALPIQEQTGAPYASQVPGVMHACGHDGHTAVGLTVVRLLHEVQAELAGTIKFVFQPAEEIMQGARRMIQDGVLEKPRPDAALALHLWNEQPLGWVSASPGPVMAAADAFRVRIEGRGAHGASPQDGQDPILAAGHIITALQSIVSRNISPLETAVVSVTQFHAGEAFNIIPSAAEIGGTIRSFSPEVRARVLARMEQIIHGIGQAMGCRASLELLGSTPAVVNDSAIADEVGRVTRLLFPEFQLETQARVMVSEDMSLLMEAVPGCYFFVGSADPEHGRDAPHHHPEFDFDEQALPVAVSVMAGAAYQLLSGTGLPRAKVGSE
jgi:amidohydrolase